MVCPYFRFIVRDFTYDPKAIAQEKHEKSKLEMQLKKQFVSHLIVVFSPPYPLAFVQGPLMNWLKVNFSQAFSAWIHLKALRVFTESVLRCVHSYDFCVSSSHLCLCVSLCVCV